MGKKLWAHKELKRKSQFPIIFLCENKGETDNMNYNTFLTLFGLNPNNFKPVVSDPFVTDSGMIFY